KPPAVLVIIDRVALPGGLLGDQLGLQELPILVGQFVEARSDLPRPSPRGLGGPLGERQCVPDVLLPDRYCPVLREPDDRADPEPYDIRVALGVEEGCVVRVALA